MSTDHKNERREPLNEIRIPLPDGQVLVLTQPVRVRFRFSGTLHVGPAETPRPAPAGCPTCAKVTSLIPEISVETGRVN